MAAATAHHRAKRVMLLAQLSLLRAAAGADDGMGLGGGADRMAIMQAMEQPDVSMPQPETLAHLSKEEYAKYSSMDAHSRKAALEGTNMVEISLKLDGSPVVTEPPIIFKYVDADDVDFWQAAKNGDLARLQHLLEQGQAVDEVQRGATAMYWAQYYLQRDAMRLLLDRGADANIKEQIGGFYPLHASAFHEEDCVGCGKLLLRYGARLDTLWYGMTPLDHARWRNRTALAAALEKEANRLGLQNASVSEKPQRAPY